MAVLLVEHDMSLVMSICDEVTVLHYGEIITTGDPTSVRADPAVQAAYLGTEDIQRTAPSGHQQPPPLRAPAPRASRPSETPSSPSPVARDTPAVVSPLLELTDVRAAYGRIEVVHGVSLRLPAGSCLALLGPNGAGKSTLLKVMSGRLAPSGGSVQLSGEEIGKASSEQLARRGICAIPEGRAVFPNLTVAENLLMYTFRGRS